MASTPTTQRILALSSKLLCVPASKTLLTQFHLITISFFAFLLSLGVVGVTLASASSSLTDAGEENCREEKGCSSTATTVDGQFGALWESGELLSHGKVRCAGCGDGLGNC